MGFLDTLFGSTDELEPQDIRAPWLRDLFKDIGMASRSGALEALRKAGKPYGGRLSAGLSEFEEGAFESLRGYLDSPLVTENDLYQQGRGEVQQTLSGEYDPYEGEYYKAYQNALKQELREAKDRLAASTSARDEHFGGGRIAETGNLERDTQNTLAQILGGLFENERARRLATVPLATQMAQFEDLAPLSRIEAGLGLGGLPRQLEQGNLDRQYAEFQRQLGSLNIPLNTAFQASTYKPEMYYPLYSSTPGLLGGPSGVGMQPGGGVNRSVLAMQSGLSALMGAGGGGGLGGATGGFLGASPGQTQSLISGLQSLFGGQNTGGLGFQTGGQFLPFG